MAGKEAARIVIADADDGFRSFLAGLLKPRGAELVQVKTAKAAERVIREHHVSLAIIDSELEDESGTALVARLRKDGSRCPIIFMEAGWKEQESYRHLTDLGVRRVMHKPFSAYELIVEVDAALSEKRDTVAPPSEALEDATATKSRRKRSYPSLPAFEAPPSSSEASPLTLALVGRNEAIESMVKAAADDAVVAIRPMRDGDEVLRRLDVESIDGALFVLEPNDPDVGLAEATEVLCSSTGKGLPVGFVCHGGDVSVQVDAIHAGGVVYLSTPIEPAHLQKAATQMAQVRQGPAPLVTLVASPRQARALSEALEHAPVTTEPLASGSALVEHLEHATPDLVLFDADTRGVSAIDVCKLLRASPRYHALPVILMTGHDGTEARMAAFEAGADDLLVKPVAPHELVTRVLARIQRVRAARDVADRDPQTGLLHRHAFVERAHAMAAEAGRAGRVVAMCVLGLDDPSGTGEDLEKQAQEKQSDDKKLAALGHLLGSRLREYDLRARWSEEEVILALPDVDARTAEPLMRRLLDALVMNGLECSAGVAIFPADEHVMESLVRVARRRWRRARGNGLDVVTIG